MLIHYPLDNLNIFSQLPRYVVLILTIDDPLGKSLAQNSACRVQPQRRGHLPKFAYVKFGPFLEYTGLLAALGRVLDERCLLHDQTLRVGHLGAHNCTNYVQLTEFRLVHLCGQSSF